MAAGIGFSVTALAQETYLYRPEKRTFQKMYLQEIAKEAETESVKA